MDTTKLTTGSHYLIKPPYFKGSMEIEAEYLGASKNYRGTFIHKFRSTVGGAMMSYSDPQTKGLKIKEVKNSVSN